MRYSTATSYLALLALGIVAVSLHASLFGDLWYAYNPDSAAYIEAARNLLAGHGLMTTPSIGITDRELTPFTLWPPGFPSLIAAGSALTGLPPKETVLWLSRGASALLPLAIAFALRPLLGLTAGAAVGVLALLSPFALEHGFLAMSDMPFLLLIVLSFGFLQRAQETRHLWFFLLLSGLLAGFAYTIRNAGLAWFVAVITTYLLSIPLRLMEPGQALRRCGVWLSGVVAAASPMWIRNLLLAGGLGTYSAPPAHGDPVGIGRSFLFELFWDLTGSHDIALIAWDAKLFILTLAPLTAILLFALVRRWLQASAPSRFGLLALTLYFGAGSAMVIIAAIKWLGGIDPRLIVQYSWLVLALGAAALVPFRKSAWSPVRTTVAALLFLALLGGRLLYHDNTYGRENTIAATLHAHPDLNAAHAALPDPDWNLRLQLARLGANDEALLAEARNLPPTTLAVSNQGYILRIGTGLRVRSIYLKEMDTPEALAAGLRKILSDYHGKPVWFAFLASNKMLKSSDAPWQDSILAALPPGCRIKSNTKHHLTSLCITPRNPA